MHEAQARQEAEAAKQCEHDGKPAAHAARRMSEKARSASGRMDAMFATRVCVFAPSLQNLSGSPTHRTPCASAVHLCSLCSLCSQPVPSSGRELLLYGQWPTCVHSNSVCHRQ